MKALDQFKQKGYVQALKTEITTDFIHSGYQDLVEFLYNVADIEGMCFIYSSTTYEQFMAQKIFLCHGIRRKKVMQV